MLRIAGLCLLALVLAASKPGSLLQPGRKWESFDPMKKIIIAAVLGLIGFEAHAACPAGSTCENYQGTIPYAGTGGTSTRTAAARAADSVNIKEFGATGDGSTDDTVAIQAAIDYAYNNQKQSIFCPNGNYKTTTALFLDAPNNLRGSAALWSSGTTYAINNVVTSAGVPWISLENSNLNNTPSVTSTHWAQTSATQTNIHFSISFVGPREGFANFEATGCRIKPTFNNSTAFWVGTGNGMSVANIQIDGPSGGYRGAQNSSGVGLCIAGGSGGANRGEIDNVLVWNFYTAFETGCNSDGLGAEFTLRKVVFSNCAIGVWFAQTQNDINSVIDPSNGGCTTAIRSGTGRPINVQGGNLSTSGIVGKFTFGTVSAITASACSFNSNISCYSFTGVITSPDGNVGSIYNSYMLKTAHFGVVPVTMTAWNGGTNTGTFSIWGNWGTYYFGRANAQTTSDLQNEIRAVTTIYGTERVTALYGSAFHVYGGTWMENAAACTTLLNSTATFNGDKGTLIERMYFNYDPSSNQYASSVTSSLGYFYCQQSFPFIDVESGTGDITFKAVNFNHTSNFGNDPVVIDMPADARLSFEQVGSSMTSSLWNPICRATSFQNTSPDKPITGSLATQNTVGFGCGVWDQTPFNVTNAAAFGGQIQGAYTFAGYGQVPFFGYRPAPYAIGRLDSTTYTTLNSIAGVTLGTYPLVDGGSIYNVLDWNSGTLTHIFARSAHKFMSYGQNLTTTNVGAGLSWNAKGQSFVVNLDAAGISWMQPGLGILLSTSANTHYVVTGVYPSLGYITVLNAEQDGTPYLIAGTKTTTYTGTLISQDAYSWTQYP